MMKVFWCGIEVPARQYTVGADGTVTISEELRLLSKQFVEVMTPDNWNEDEHGKFGAPLAFQYDAESGEAASE